MNGNMDCLVYAHQNGCRWNKETCSVAARMGYLECLKYARENGCPWDELTCASAVENGNMDCLVYAHQNGCPWNEETCSVAAKRGYLECLKYARENGCPWDERTCEYAAKNRNMDCLAYALKNGCPWKERKCSNAEWKVKWAAWFTPEKTGALVTSGHVSTLQRTGTRNACLTPGETRKQVPVGRVVVQQYVKSGVLKIRPRKGVPAFRGNDLRGIEVYEMPHSSL